MGTKLTEPIGVPATLLSLVAGTPTEQMEPIPHEVPADPTVKVERPPAMTLLGVAPVTRSHRASAPRIAMPALSPVAPLPPAPRRRRSMWDRVFGRLSALLRTIRWAFRRRRGVRSALRRLPTRT